MAGNNFERVSPNNRARPPQNNNRLPQRREKDGIRSRIPNWKISIIRPEDFLVLEFQFLNLRRNKDKLFITNHEQPAYLIVHFPPQHISEEAFFDNWPPDLILRMAKARMAGPSRLVFRIPPGEAEITYSLPGLLAKCREWHLNLSPVATGKFVHSPSLKLPTANRPTRPVKPRLPDHSTHLHPPLPSKPNQNETAIECPYRLILSPSRTTASWDHRLEPIIHNGRTELWHTQLEDNQARAIWSPDYTAQNSRVDSKENPFRMSLDATHRSDIVHNTSGWRKNKFPNRRPYRPLPFQVKRMMLTALGSWLDIEGNWKTRPKGIALSAWTHQATMGRDHYVKIVEEGFCFPLCHAMARITISERKCDDTNPDQPIAPFRQRICIVVREPEKYYSPEKMKYNGRQFPFRRIRIITTKTPDLDPPEKNSLNLPGISKKAAFCPHVNGQPFQFQIVAEDLSGRQCYLSMPLIFLSEEKGLPYKQTFIQQVINKYKEKISWREILFSGKTVRFAENRKKGDTDLETQSITLSGEYNKKCTPSFHPAIVKASVINPAIQKLLGTTQPICVEYFKPYLKHGFDKTHNPGEVYFKLTKSQLLSFGGGVKSDKVGAIITPNFKVLGVSRIYGPVGSSKGFGLQDSYTSSKKTAQSSQLLAQSQDSTDDFDPKEFFLNSAKFLGGIALSEILGTVSDINPLDDGDSRLPRLVSEVRGSQWVTEFFWETNKFQETDLFVPRGTTTLFIQATSTADIPDPGHAPQAPETHVFSEINDFEINLFSYIILKFDQISFESWNGKKPDVNVSLNKLEPITFGGRLEFINDLKKYIPIDGFSDPPNLDVTERGIVASYSLTLPDITLGVFSLRNLSLGAGFELPFDGSEALVRFNFCKKHNPFVLTVSFLGGGGYFAITVGTSGIRKIEAALEVRGELALNIGVASGGVYARVGIYFSYENIEKEEVILSGFVEIGGALSILGIVTISLTFYLALRYEVIDGQSSVYGIAILTIEIEILLFSIPVELKVERRFAGSATSSTTSQKTASSASVQNFSTAARSAPKPLPEADGQALSFQDLITENNWHDYCEAFA